MSGPLVAKLNPEQMLRNAHIKMRRTAYYRTGFVPLWAFVSDITGHGSTVSAEICRELGWNPGANMRDHLPPRQTGAAP